MSEKIGLPVPGSQTSLPRRSQLPKILLGTLLALAILINFSDSIPGSSYIRALSPKCGLSTSDSIYDVEVRYDEAWFKDHVECPAQPKPIHPKMVWNMTDEEKKASIEKYAQSVVCQDFRKVKMSAERISEYLPRASTIMASRRKMYGGSRLWIFRNGSRRPSRLRERSI